MKKLEQLTAAQEAQMIITRDFWKNYIFSCKNTEINKESARIGIDWMYNMSSKKEPIVIYVDSPLGCQFAVAYLKEFVKQTKFNFALANVWANVGDNVGDNVWDNVRANVGANVGANVWDNVWANVRANVWANVWANVRANVWANVGDNVGDNVWDNVRANVGANVGANVWDNVWANVRANVWANVGDNVGDNVWANVRANVWANVWANVRANVWANVGDNVGDNVWDNVRANVGANVGANVWANVGANVRANVRANVGANVWDNVWANVGDNVRDAKLNFEEFSSYGNIGDYGWVSLADFFTEIGVINHEKFNQFKKLLLSGIYDMIQLEGFCIVSSLPIEIHRNQKEQLHCENGAAIKFKDSYEQYYWNGVNVPSKIILTPELVTKEEILKEQNAEIRRCYREKLGAKKYYDIISDGKGLTLIDEDIDNQGFPMKLYETTMNDGLLNKKVQFIEVVDPSTERMYNIYPPNQRCKNVWEAKASTFNDNKLFVRQGDVGLVKQGVLVEKPLVET